MVTVAAPRNRSRWLEPGTRVATPGAMVRPAHASCTRTGASPKELPSRTRICDPPVETRAIIRTVTSGDVPCRPCSDASHKAAGAELAAAAEAVTGPAPARHRAAASATASMPAVERIFPVRVNATTATSQPSEGTGDSPTIGAIATPVDAWL